MSSRKQLTLDAGELVDIQPRVTFWTASKHVGWWIVEDGGPGLNSSRPPVTPMWASTHRGLRAEVIVKGAR